MHKYKHKIIIIIINRKSVARFSSDRRRRHAHVPSAYRTAVYSCTLSQVMSNTTYTIKYNIRRGQWSLSLYIHLYKTGCVRDGLRGGFIRHCNNRVLRRSIKLIIYTACAGFYDDPKCTVRTRGSSYNIPRE